MSGSAVCASAHSPLAHSSSPAGASSIAEVTGAISIPNSPSGLLSVDEGLAGNLDSASALTLLFP